VCVNERLCLGLSVHCCAEDGDLLLLISSQVQIWNLCCSENFMYEQCFQQCFSRRPEHFYMGVITT
jgi:hypothetical protein